jgi:hypothetical protein
MPVLVRTDLKLELCPEDSGTETPGPEAEAEALPPPVGPAPGRTVVLLL